MFDSFVDTSDRRGTQQRAGECLTASRWTTTVAPVYGRPAETFAFDDGGHGSGRRAGRHRSADAVLHGLRTARASAQPARRDGAAGLRRGYADRAGERG